MGEIENRPHDPSQMRISEPLTASASPDVLRDAAGEGRIDLDELEERLEADLAGQDLRRAGAESRSTCRRRGLSSHPPAPRCVVRRHRCPPSGTTRPSRS